MTITLASIRDQWLVDLEAAMPGCDITIALHEYGMTAVATHRITGRALTCRLDGQHGEATGNWAVSFRGANYSGRAATGFDSALDHAYRHDLDFTAEYGPGTAWSYHLQDQYDATRHLARD